MASIRRAFLTPPGHRGARARHAVLGFSLAAIVLAVLAGTLWAAPPAYRRSGAALAGELRIVGSSDTATPVARWATILRREHPAVRVVTALYGAGAGAGAMVDGEADLVPLHRVLLPKERSMLTSAGVQPKSVTIGRWTDGARPYVLYFRRTADGGSDAIAREFVRIALSDEGRSAIAAADKNH